MVSKKSSKDRSYELKKLKAECVAEENNRYNISQAKRKSGSGEVPAGNTGLKATKRQNRLLMLLLQKISLMFRSFQTIPLLF